MEVKKPLLKRKLFISDSLYYLNRSQVEGENDLGKISENAKREDSWIFYKDSGLWLHLPNNHFEQISQDGNLELGCDCPLLYESSLGKEAIHYHIHPNLFVTNTLTQAGDRISAKIKEDLIDVLFAWYSMPSNEDVRTITEKGKGYEHKIVTTRGITSMRSNPNGKLHKIANPERFFRDCVDPAVISTRGFEAGIEDALGKANKEFGEYLHSAYEARSN